MNRPDWTVASLLARVEQLEAALRPFADSAAHVAHRPLNVRLWSTYGGDVTVGDLQRARAALYGED